MSDKSNGRAILVQWTDGTSSEFMDRSGTWKRVTMDEAVTQLEKFGFESATEAVRMPGLKYGNNRNLLILEVQTTTTYTTRTI